MAASPIGPGLLIGDSGPFAANIPVSPAYRARRSKVGRYTVSVITLMEIALFGIALVVFVIGVLILLISR